MNKEKLNKIKYYILSSLELLIFPCICFILLESIKFGNIVYYFQLLSRMLSNGSQYVLVAYIILLGLTLIIRSISKNKFISNIILVILMLCITLISHYKYIALEQPFVPSDILLVGNLNQITEFGFTGISHIMIMPVLILICVLIIDYYIYEKIKNKINTTVIERIIFCVAGIIIIFTTCISTNRYTKFKIKNDNGDNYSWMGANAVFFMHLGDFYTPKPTGYNEEKIEKLKEKYDGIEEKVEGNMPNVILIMNESFSDLSNLEKTQYSENPMKIINEIKEDKNSMYGTVLTPVFGGGTSLPEFEVLTGLSSYFLEDQIYPYTSYIRDNTNSLVRVFNKNNYTTVGIHTNTRTFYNRFNIYKYLGFKKTIFEEDIVNPDYKGNYISDDEAANQIIKVFENNEGKKFIFTVTMQNHMKYLNKEYEEYDIEISSDVLTNKEILELKNYTQGIVDANKMYKKIMEYLKKQEEPTILIMFGDHKPLLGDSYCSTFKKNELSSIEYYTTPYIIWANYSIEDKTIPDFLSTSNLGLNILDLANIKDIPWYFKPFKELYNEYPVINNKCIINKEGKIIKRDEIEDDGLLLDCQVLQYELLIKNKYITIYK